MRSIKERFESKIELIPFHTCWEWTGCKSKGYGLFQINRRSVRAHRFSYKLYKGDFDENLKILHSCDNPSCVNPDHLRVGTQVENIKDRVERNRGSRMKYDKNGNSKLTWKEVNEIRSKYKYHTYSFSKIASN